MSQVILTKHDQEKIISAFHSKKVAIFPNDTIYGMCAPALNKDLVEKIYSLKKRSINKPLIILISSIEDFHLFNIKIDKSISLYLEKIWPAKITVIIDCFNNELDYLHRGTNSLAFRFPDNDSLISLIKESGPLVSSSVNYESMNPATNIQEAYQYFQENAIYIDKGTLLGKPSTIISLANNEFKIIRQGDYILKQDEYYRPSINN